MQHGAEKSKKSYEFWEIKLLFPNYEHATLTKGKTNFNTNYFPQKFLATHFGTGFSDVSLELERDAFNLNKLIFAVTRVGKIHVLHSSSGR